MMKKKQKKKYFKEMWGRILQDIDLDKLIRKDNLIESEDGESYLYRYSTDPVRSNKSLEPAHVFTARIELKVEKTFPTKMNMPFMDEMPYQEPANQYFTCLLGGKKIEPDEPLTEEEQQKAKIMNELIMSFPTFCGKHFPKKIKAFWRGVK